MNAVTEISIIGGGGFIGGHLIDALSERSDVLLNVLFQETDYRTIDKGNVRTFKGDLLEPASLTCIMKEGASVINLAYLANETREINIAAMQNMVDCCRANMVKRLIHLSTAVVAGRCDDNVVSEESLCRPVDEYECIKYDVENFLMERAKDQFEIIILRPTAVFGPGGRNLLKLADNLRNGTRLVNYIKSCLMSSRRMNLICVDNVVAAIEYFVDRDNVSDDSIYILSDDDNPCNNYRYIEKRLMELLGLNDYFLPVYPLNGYILKILFKAIGRSNANPDRVYSCQKLLNEGFVKKESLDGQIAKFAEWYNGRC